MSNTESSADLRAKVLALRAEQDRMRLSPALADAINNYRAALAREKGWESHVCGRRSEGPVPAFAGESDLWETEGWSLDSYGHGERHAVWPQGFAQPRTCSYCGGVHPDDVIALLEQGWEVEGTTKAYKRYLNPPAGSDRPSPPVKVYGQHFTNEQRDRFNALAVLAGHRGRES